MLLAKAYVGDIVKGFNILEAGATWGVGTWTQGLHVFASECCRFQKYFDYCSAALLANQSCFFCLFASLPRQLRR